jgi:hypothetical protein
MCVLQLLHILLDDEVRVGGTADLYRARHNIATKMTKEQCKCQQKKYWSRKSCTCTMINVLRSQRLMIILCCDSLEHQVEAKLSLIQMLRKKDPAFCPGRFRLRGHTGPTLITRPHYMVTTDVVEVLSSFMTHNIHVRIFAGWGHTRV